MFLAMLNESQKKAFLSLAARFAAEDKLVAKGELGWIDGLKREMGMGKRTKAGDDLPEDLFPVFDTHTARVIAALEIIRLGYVDGHYSSAEKAFVERMAMAFKFPRELVSALDNWAVRHTTLTSEAANLMLGKEDTPPS